MVATVPATSQKDKSSQSRGPRPRSVGPSAGSAKDAGAEQRVPKSKSSRPRAKKRSLRSRRRRRGRWVCLAHSLRCATARFTSRCLLLTWVYHILQDGQTSADLYPTIECTPRLLRVQAGTMQGASPGVVELWQLNILPAGERLLLECTAGRHGVCVLRLLHTCLELFKRDNPDFSVKSFLGDGKQPPV